MRILVIAEHIGRTAPGMVFERLVAGLSQMHSVDVITTVYEPGEKLGRLNKVIQLEKKAYNHRLPKLLIGTLGINHFDVFWSRKAIARLDDTAYDLVFCLISFHSYVPLITGINYAGKKGVKLAVYSVDAIPAPIGWSQNDRYFRKVSKMMADLLPKTDYFFSANKQMLEYQKTLFKPKAGAILDVIYNPNDGELKNLPDAPPEPNVFLYTGGIYQARKAGYVLKAFENLLTTHPDSSLVFVGTKFFGDTLALVSDKVRSRISVKPFARDLMPYYQQATALLDIDADLKDDVFLSSKIINYLLINRIIISETGENSPSRKLFGNIPSILQCGHNADELTRAMEHAIAQKSSADFNDRKNVIALFDIRNVVKKIDKIIGVVEEPAR